MKAPRIPSFFKNTQPRKFHFHARYYDKQKERREQAAKTDSTNIKFTRAYNQKNKQNRAIRIIFVFMFLSVLVYKLILN